MVIKVIGKNEYEKDERYNGWKNVETWALNLCLTNDQGIYNEIIENIKEGYIKNGDDLKDWLEELFYDENYNIVFVGDSFSMREWDEIDFDEIYDYFREIVDYEDVKSN